MFNYAKIKHNSELLLESQALRPLAKEWLARTTAGCPTTLRI